MPIIVDVGWTFQGFFVGTFIKKNFFFQTEILMKYSTDYPENYTSTTKQKGDTKQEKNTFPFQSVISEMQSIYLLSGSEDSTRPALKPTIRVYLGPKTQSSKPTDLTDG